MLRREHWFTSMSCCVGDGRSVPEATSTVVGPRIGEDRVRGIGVDRDRRIGEDRDRKIGEDRDRKIDDLRLAFRAATWYYLDGLTQAEIAGRLGVSRPTAGRLVARARDRGLVRIEVEFPSDLSGDVHAEIEHTLEQRFGLTEVVVVSSRVDDIGPVGMPRSFTPLARAAAGVIARRLRPGDALGFTWGPETIAVADALGRSAAGCRVVVQLDGSLTTGAYRTGAEYVLARAAEHLHAEPIRLPVPLYADPATVASMRTDSMISTTLAAGRDADVMVFGTGAVAVDTTLVAGSFLDHADIDDLTARGAKGEIGGRFFDADGVPLSGRPNDVAMSVELEDIRDCPTSVLIAGGATRHEAVLGAIRGGFASILICDIECARWLLTAAADPIPGKTRT